MQKIFHILWCLCFTLSMQAQQVELKTIQLPVQVSIRTMQAINDSVVWFAANRGVWGFTKDGGNNWYIDSIAVDGKYPEFRSMAALNDSTVLLLSIDSPAYLFRTNNYGNKWQRVYSNFSKGIFFDSMTFKDSLHGIAISDPIDGHFMIIKTTDGGNKWQEVKVTVPAENGEGCFAASNTNLFWQQNTLIFATGGSTSRLFISDNDGASFLPQNTPMLSGSTMTGIFTMYFENKTNGLIGGGNYLQSDTTTTLYQTNNGGKTWQPIKLPEGAFVSCAKTIKTKKDNYIIVTGHNGTYLIDSRHHIKDIKNIENQILPFYTISATPSQKQVWLAGKSGKMAVLKIY